MKGNGMKIYLIYTVCDFMDCSSRNHLLKLMVQKHYVGYVAGISPLLQGRNGYLPSIGQKDRFLVMNAENE